MGGVCRLGEQVGAGATEDVGMGIDAPAAKLLLVREAVDTRGQGTRKGCGAQPSAGATKRRKLTNVEMGFPGKQITGVS